MKNVLWSSLGLSLVLLGTVACGGSQQDPEVHRGEIEDTLRQYLPHLGEAYATQNSSVLEGMAVAKEIARIDLRIDELDQEGRVYEPEFREVTVEDVSVWNYANAFVTTLEVWDVRSFTTGSRVPIQESLGQRSRVKYQLKRKGDSWVILYRELAQTLE